MKIKLILFTLVLTLFSGCNYQLTGEVPSDMIDWTGNQVIAGFSQDEEKNTNLDVTASSSNTYYKISPLNTTEFTIGNSSQIYLNETEGKIYLSEGIYQINMGMSFSTDKISIVHCDIFINDNETVMKFERSINNINQVGNANTMGYLQVDTNDYIYVKCKSTSMNNVITINDMYFNARRLY